MLGLFNTIKQDLPLIIQNYQGWRTNRKIIVIESDDWGTIRMPSKQVFNKLLSFGIRVDNCPFNKYDSLATQDDLEALFTVLHSFKDKNGKPAVITANTIVCNPSFEKISQSNFDTYHYESFTKTLDSYDGKRSALPLWFEGIDAGVFVPQFHGREHVNVNRWLQYLQNKSKETLEAFHCGVFGLSTNIVKEKRRSYLAAYDYESIEEIDYISQSIQEGTSIFRNIFGYHAKSFIAPNYTWDSPIEEVLIKSNIKYLQSGPFQQLPIGGKELKLSIRRITGEINSFNQIYTVRNCTFEPSVSPDIDSVANCLRQISLAFRCKTPAIINSHRLNFIGRIEEKNRTSNIILLKKLLKEITRRWPDVEFLSSDNLGVLIDK